MILNLPKLKVIAENVQQSDGLHLTLIPQMTSPTSHHGFAITSACRLTDAKGFGTLFGMVSMECATLLYLDVISYFVIAAGDVRNLIEASNEGTEFGNTYMLYPLGTHHIICYNPKEGTPGGKEYSIAIIYVTFSLSSPVCTFSGKGKGKSGCLESDNVDIYNHGQGNHLFFVEEWKKVILVITLTSHSIPLKKNVGTPFPPILMRSINPLALHDVLDEVCGHHCSPPNYLDFDTWYLKLLVRHMISTSYIRHPAIVDSIMTNFCVGYQTISNSSASTMWMCTGREINFSHGDVGSIAKKSYNELSKKDTKTPLILHQNTTKQYDHDKEEKQNIVSKRQEMGIKKPTTYLLKIRKKNNKKITNRMMIFALVKIILLLCMDFANGIKNHEKYSTTKNKSLRSNKKEFDGNKENTLSFSRKLSTKIITQKTKNGDTCSKNKQCKSKRCRYLLKDKKSEGKICLPKKENLLKNASGCKRDWQCKSRQCIDEVCRPKSLLTVGSVCNGKNDCLTERCKYRKVKDKSKGKICFPKKEDLIGVGFACKKPWQCRSRRCIKKVCNPKKIKKFTYPSSKPSTNPSSNSSSYPSSKPSSTPSSNPSSTPSSNPSSTPSSNPSSTPSSTPSSKPSTNPSSKPSSYPSSKPSSNPSSNPSSKPSSNPSTNPSSRPSTKPSSNPSTNPSSNPSTNPSSNPSFTPSSSLNPSSHPSTNPTTNPSMIPSSMPSTNPSSHPSTNPSSEPSFTPSSSLNPSSNPSFTPSSSLNPSSKPSTNPSSEPSMIPSSMPSTNPSSHPSTNPSSEPSFTPSSSLNPSSNPSSTPSSSLNPSSKPSTNPSSTPSSNPSVSFNPSSTPSSNPSVSFNPSSNPSSNPSFYWVQIGGDIDGEAAGDTSGNSVSMSSGGTVVAIGAKYNNAGGFSKGHVRVYSFDGTNWLQRGKGIDGEEDYNYFGTSVALSSNGNTVVIGAPNHRSDSSYKRVGQVKVYTYDGSSWSQIGAWEGESDYQYFGRSVATSSDGSIVAIGCIWEGNPGYVKVYAYDGTNWAQRGGTFDGDDEYDQAGSTIDLSEDGSILAFGLPLHNNSGGKTGCVRVYNYDGTTWSQRGADIYGEVQMELFGTSVALSSNGEIVAIGSIGGNFGNGNVQVYAYEAGSTSWSQLGADIDGESTCGGPGCFFGHSVDISSDGNTVAIGAHFNYGNNGSGGASGASGGATGHVRVYNYDGTSWLQVGGDIDGEGNYDLSGYSVALSSDGKKVAIGAPNNDGNGSSSGHVRVFHNYQRSL